MAPRSGPALRLWDGLLLAAFGLSCQAKSGGGSSADAGLVEAAGPAAAGSTTVDMPALEPCKVDQGECETKCDKGSLESCLTLAVMLASGKGATKDSSRAVALFVKACDGDLAEGCGGLAEMYLLGDGITRDVQEAATLYERACGKGDAVSCGSLAGLYVGVDPKGQGLTPQDAATALKWYERACDLRNIDACVNVGALLLTGAGGEKDPNLAHDMFGRGCDANNAVACKLLADGYARGEGVAKDEKRARELYDKACKGGNARACKDGAK